LTVNLPNPKIETSSPFADAAAIWSNTAVIAFFAKASFEPVASATPLATANDATKTVLDDASAAAGWLMLDKFANYDVGEVCEATSRQGAIADLAAEAMRARNIDL